jgi:hypothetical protein
MKRSKSKKDRQYNGQKKKRTKGKKMLWVSTCSFISLSIGTSYSGISRITKRNQPYPVISRFAIDNVPSLNNSMLGDFIDLIYPKFQKT